MEYADYEPKGLALDIFKKRYAISEAETFSEACDRVAYHIASGEAGANIQKWTAKFSDMLKKNLFFPGGRIMYGSGRAKGQLLNCFVIPTHDSREGWGKSVSDMIIISGTGGGVGINGSPIRPRGAKIDGTGGTATGAVSLMRIINAAGEVIKAGGGRRVALMMALEHDHGDIEEFMDAKLDRQELNNANVSVIFQKDPEAFFEQVKKNLEYELKHNGKAIRKLSAADVWKKIIKNALVGGEPGVLNGYYANKMNNIWYYKDLICTNPCVTGDTLIATADGRNAVSIKQLADEMKDVEVYSTNIETGRVEIKTGRFPRKTGDKKEVWKLTLDDRSVLRATPNHKIMKRDCSYVELKDLQPGDSIFPFNSFDSNGYRQICTSVANNHKVVSVEFVGYEDVYNITVDDNHNYHVITSAEDGKYVTSSGICVKNCGEIWLIEYDCCCLGSVVLPRFVDVDKKEIDWKMLEETVSNGVRFLDNVLTVNNYPMPEIRDMSTNIRRIGLGVTGLHDMLLLMGLRYNSAAGLELVDELMKRIKNAAYKASIDLAIEKGAFPQFDPEQFCKSGFIKTLKPSLRESIREHGIRNCTLLTIPPVGTGSMVCDTSSGVEPMFAPAYKRKYRDGDALKEEVVIHPLFKKFMDAGKSVKHFQKSHELKMRDHLEMQRTVQRHIDSAVSKTINIPPGVSEKELSELYFEFLPELKGITVYPDGSRENQPLTPMDLDEAILAYRLNAESGAAGNDNCKDGSCDI